MSDRIDYREYIASDEWKERRKDAFRRSSLESKMFRPCCEVCGRYGAQHKNRAEGRDHHYRVDGTNGLQVHHVHYRNLGNEDPDDLIVLCTSALTIGSDDWTPRSGCHERAHDDADYRRKVAWFAEARRLRIAK